MKNFRHSGFLTIFLSVFMVCNLSAQTRSASAECEITQDKQYFIKVKGSNKYVRYLGSEVENQFAIADLEAGDSFKFTFIETEESDVYNIAVVGTEGFLSNVHDGWRLGLGEDQGTNGQIRVSFDEECFITLSGMWNSHDGNYIGLDDNIPELWGNKTAEHWWELEEVREIAPCGDTDINTELEYYIRSASRNLYLRYDPTVGDSEFGVGTPISGNDGFKFRFIKVDGQDNVYNVSTSEGYINHHDGWKLILGQETDANGSIRILASGEDCSEYTFGGLWNDRLFDMDADKSWVYADKSTGAKWVLEEATDTEPCDDELNIDTEAEYYIKNASRNLYLRYDAELPDDNSMFRVAEKIEDNTDFVFKFTAVDGQDNVYNISCNDGYINTDEFGWALKPGLDTETLGQIEVGKAGFDCSLYTFGGLWNEMFFDLDPNNDRIFANKETAAGWVLEKIAGTGTKTTIPTKTATVYPTFSKGTVTITTPQAATVKVYDLSGKVLDTYVSNGNITIDMNYANGVYFIAVESDSVETYKVILQK